MNPEVEVQLINAILTFLHRDTKLTPQEIETFQACNNWLQGKGQEMSDLAQQLAEQAAKDEKKPARKPRAKK